MYICDIVSVDRWTMVPTYILVRYIRGYREQHEKQAVPKQILNEYRTSKLSANVQSPLCSHYTDEERAIARRFRYIYIYCYVNSHVRKVVAL